MTIIDPRLVLDLMDEERQKQLSAFPGTVTAAPIGTSLDAPKPVAEAAPAPSIVAPTPKAAPIGPVAPVNPVTPTNPQLEKDQAELSRLKNSAPGIDQYIAKPGVGHKILGALGKVGDIAGSALFPGVAAMVPGTTLHHRMLTNEAASNVANDLATEQEQAETKEKEAKAEQETATAYERLHPTAKPKKAPVVKFSQGGEPLSVVDSNTGDEYVLGDPNMPPELKGLADRATQNYTNNQTAKTKPLSKDQAEALNQLWDGIAEKYHLPKGQFHEGMPHDDATALQTSLNNVVGRSQGGQRIVLSQSGDKGSARADKSYQYNSGVLDKVGTPIEQLIARMGRLQEGLKQGTPQADALIGPELLSVMAGGAGTGLRMNEAEISRVVGGRSQWESLKADINKWSLDPSKANSITPAQRKQIRALVDEVSKRVLAKQQILDGAREDLLNTDDPKEHRRIVTEARKKLTGIDVEQAGSGGGSAQGMVIKIGNKNYRYKGTGDTSDLKNYEEVKQ